MESSDRHITRIYNASACPTSLVLSMNRSDISHFSRGIGESTLEGVGTFQPLDHNMRVSRVHYHFKVPFHL